MIRRTGPEDTGGIRRIYRRAAAVRHGLLREPEEITEDYAADLAGTNLRGGIGLGYWTEGILRGEIHAKHGTCVRAHRHLLQDVGIAVDPAAHGRGIGRQLFTALLEIVERERPDIYRVELYAFARNERNVRFYEALGFIEEGRYPGKNLQPDGTLETPISMAWINPGYKHSGPVGR